MDAELKQYLEAMQANLEGKIDRAAVATASEIGSLHTEIQQVEQRLGTRLDEISARLDTHAGLLQTGARQMTRFFQFTERSGSYWRALAKRVDDLERKSPKNGKSHGKR